MTIWLQIEPNVTTESRSSVITVSSVTNKGITPSHIEIKQEGIDPQINILTQIPDLEFRKYCTTFDTNEDGILSPKEASSITEIKINSKYSRVKSLEGVSFFTNLQTLRLSDLNELTSLDIKNPKLEFIRLLGNSKLEEIDLSNLLNLKSIDFEYTGLKKILVGNSSSIEQILLEKNEKLTELTLGDNPSLKKIHSNIAPLESLYLEKLPALDTLEIYGSNLTNIDVQYCAMLTALKLLEHHIETIDITKNKELRSFSYGAVPIEMLDLSHNLNLEELYITETAIKQINLNSNKKLKSVICIENDLESLELTDFPNLERLRIYKNKIATLNLNLENLQELDCHNNALKDLDLAYLPKLNTLICDKNEFAILDLSSLKSLNYFSLVKNPQLSTVYIPQYVMDDIKDPNTVSRFHHDEHTELIVK